MQVMQYITLGEVHLKWSVILMDLLGQIFSTLWMKEQVLQHEKCTWEFQIIHWLVINFWLKKIPMFLQPIQSFQSVQSVQSFQSMQSIQSLKSFQSFQSLQSPHPSHSFNPSNQYDLSNPSNPSNLSNPSNPSNPSNLSNPGQMD